MNTRMIVLKISKNLFVLMKQVVFSYLRGGGDKKKGSRKQTSNNPYKKESFIEQLLIHHLHYTN